MRVAFFFALAACGSQQSSAQTQTPAPSQSASPPTPSQTPVVASAAAATCKTSDDCAMSTSRSCCAPCALPPFADLKSEVDTLKRRCSEVECATREVQECKPTESVDAYHAACENAACVAVRNPPKREPPQTQTPVVGALLTSSAACARDADCTVSNFSDCCSQCPTSAYATSNAELKSSNARCAIVDCSMDRTPRCAPFVDASLYRAVCRAGTCAGVKR